jgi:Cu(I)/Ag(I) efflux system membrane fusion protein
MKARDPRIIAVVTSAALVLLVGALVVQHLRHGWPFSLHHGVTAAAPKVRVVPPAGAGAAPSHPRAAVEIDPAPLAAIGVRIERVQAQRVSEPIRTVATVVPDESRVSHVHTRVSGWIERLHVTTTGERVRAGQPLASIFSQELLSSQAEYLSARRAAAAGPRSAVVDGARARLRVLGMTDAEIRGIEEADAPRRLVTVTAPRSGVVLHRGISVGTAVDPSTEIVTVADLSRVWVLAEVPERDIPRVRVGTPARLEFPASGRDPVAARVEFLYPTLSERTRTLRARFSVENRTGALRPGLYGSATFQLEPRVALTAPRDAIVDTGRAQHVFVVAGPGHFLPRQVVLGARFDERIEVLHGLAAGESIVASGVFLIDSESRLRASGGGTGHAHGSVDQERSGGAHENHAAPGPGRPAPGSSPRRDPAAGDHEPHAPPPPAGGQKGH